MELKGTISAIFKRCIELFDAQAVGTIPDQLAGVKFPTRILMTRSSFRKKPDLVGSFVDLLDSGEEVTFISLVSLDAITGRPTWLKFLDFSKAE